MVEPHKRVEFDLVSDAIQWCRDETKKTGLTYHVYERCQFFACTEWQANNYRIRDEPVAITLGERNGKRDSSLPESEHESAGRTEPS